MKKESRLTKENAKIRALDRIVSMHALLREVRSNSLRAAFVASVLEHILLYPYALRRDLRT